MSPTKAKPKEKPKKRSQRPKSTAKTTGAVDVPVGALIPQPHGGALRNGGTNVGGAGRPPSLIREKLRGSFEDRIVVLEQIADGTPIEHVEVPLAAVLGYLVCPDCDKALVPKPEHVADALLITVEAKRSARAGDRTKSLDIMAKYGLGEKSETEIINHPEFSRQAQAYQACVHEALAERLGPTVVQEIEALIEVKVREAQLAALTGGRRDG